MKVAIVGGGIAGLFAAWYLSKMGDSVQVTVLEKGEVGHGATWKAAGMLAPVNELEFQEIDLLRAGLASRDLYFKEVAPALGEIGLRAPSSLEVALHPDDGAYLRRQYEFQVQQGLDVEWLSHSAAIQDVEPFVSRQLQQAIWSRSDTQVDNWMLVRRLAAALTASGVQVEEGAEVQRWEVDADGGARLLANGEWRSYDRALLALGVPGAAQAAALPYKLYPVHGEMLSLQGLEGDGPQTQVRIASKVLGKGYVVPKADRILCGSTSEERGLDLHNTAGGLLNILRRCYAAVPAIAEMRVQEVWSGLRPSTLDRMPVLGREGSGPFFHLNGLYRHGILLGPLMGKSAARLLLGLDPLPETLPFILQATSPSAR